MQKAKRVTAIVLASCVGCLSGKECYGSLSFRASINGATSEGCACCAMARATVLDTKDMRYAPSFLFLLTFPAEEGLVNQSGSHLSRHGYHSYAEASGRTDRRAVIQQLVSLRQTPHSACEWLISRNVLIGFTATAVAIS